MNNDLLLKALEGAGTRYQYPQKAFVAFLHEKDLDVDDPAAWRLWVATMKKRPSATQSSYLSAAKALVRSALLIRAEDGDISAHKLLLLVDEMKAVLRPSKKRPDPKSYIPHRTLTHDEVRRLVECARTEGWGLPSRSRKDGSVATSKKHARHEIALAIEFLWGSGMRISDMTNLKLKDIKAKGDLCQIRSLSAGNERWVTVPRDLVDRCRGFFLGTAYLFEHHGKKYTRTHISTSIRRVGLAVLGREISAQTIRHSAAVHHLAKGGDIEATSEFLGHSSVGITADLYGKDHIDPAANAGIMDAD